MKNYGQETKILTRQKRKLFRSFVTMETLIISYVLEAVLAHLVHIFLYLPLFIH